jgi:hypothetical protein
VLATVTLSADVEHAATRVPPGEVGVAPDAGAPPDAPAFGVPVPLAPPGPELLVEDEADCCGAVGLLPEDPQAATIAAAAVSDAAAMPRRAVTEIVIIPMPFVIGRERSAQTSSGSRGGPQPSLARTCPVGNLA